MLAVVSYEITVFYYACFYKTDVKGTKMKGEMMKRIGTILNVIFGKYWTAWMGIIVGIVLGASVFSIFVLVPKGLENWISAGGTLLAVFVSLYLANKPKKKGELNLFDSRLEFKISHNNNENRKISEIGMTCFMANTGERSLLVKNVTCLAFGQTTNLLDHDKNKSILLNPGEIKEITLSKDISHVWFSGESMFQILDSQTNLLQYVRKQGVIIGIVGEKSETFTFDAYHGDVQQSSTQTAYSFSQ